MWLMATILGIDVAISDFVNAKVYFSVVNEVCMFFTERAV